MPGPEMRKPKMPRSFEILREDAKRVAEELKDLPVDDWDQRNRAMMRLANVLVELIDKLGREQKTDEG